MQCDHKGITHTWHHLHLFQSVGLCTMRRGVVLHVCVRCRSVHSCLSPHNVLCNVKLQNKDTVKQPIIPTVVQLSFAGLLAFREKQLCYEGQLHSEKINIHCVSVTLCEYLSQYEVSRDRDPCNQYLLVLPSEELDFTIRSACSPDTTSNIIS